MLALEEGEEVLFTLQIMFCYWLPEEEGVRQGRFNGVDGQAGSSGTSSEGKASSQVTNGGTDG